MRNASLCSRFARGWRVEGGIAACAAAWLLLAAASPVWAAEVADYLSPGAVAVSPDGKHLYVACEDARLVLWVELPSGKVVRRVAVVERPTGLAVTPDGARLLVTCAAVQSTVAVLDAVSGQALAAIAVGHTATGPAVSPDGRWLYACNRFDNDVSVIDLRACRQVARVPAVREPIAAAVTPNGESVLVANHLPLSRTDAAFRDDVSPVVTLIDTRTRRTTAIPLIHGCNGLRSVCVTHDGRWAFVTHLLSNFEELPFRVDMGWINVNVVSIIDLVQRKVVRTLGMDEQDMGAGNPWDVVCTPDGQSVCVSLSGTHELCVIELASLLGESARTMSPMMGVWPIYPSLGGSLWRRVKLPGQGPRALAASGSTVYTALYFSDRVAVVDTAADEAVRPAAIALGPPAQISLERRGEMLFHDATICYQRWLSCASCHPDGRVDGLNWDLMNDGVGNSKNTKSMVLAHVTPPSMAEGVRMSAEEAVRSGLKHILFADQVEEESATAIDAYLKTLQPVPSPRLIGGRLSPAARRGRELFHSSRIDCVRCHPGPHYTDLQRHNVGSRGRQEHNDFYDTPSLVETWRTAPYMHDGRWPTIRELLGEGRHGHPRRGGLSEKEVEELAEFVLSL